jgi:hypothetical protein
VTREGQQAGQQAFVLSQTHAPVRFTAIPQGSQPLRVVAGQAIAEGFRGPSGSGSEIAYLRWRRDDVTYEIDAVLTSWLTEGDLRAIAAALMEEQR